MTEVFFKDWLAAWHGNRPEQLLEFYHDNCTYQDPANPAGLQGRAALGTYLTKLLRKYPDWVWELDSFYQSGETYFVKWKATINQKKTTGLDLVKFKDQKIVHNEVYFDASVFVLGSNPTTK